MKWSAFMHKIYLSFFQHSSEKKSEEDSRNLWLRNVNYKIEKKISFRDRKKAIEWRCRSKLVSRWCLHSNLFHSLITSITLHNSTLYSFHSFRGWKSLSEFYGKILHLLPAWAGCHLIGISLEFQCNLGVSKLLLRVGWIDKKGRQKLEVDDDDEV